VIKLFFVLLAVEVIGVKTLNKKKIAVW